MSFSHHGEMHGPDSEIMKRFLEQVEGKAKRQFPAGRMGHDDDGTLAFAITTDTQRKVVTIRFGKPVEWIGLGPDDCVKLAQKLIDCAKEISDKPLMISF